MSIPLQFRTLTTTMAIIATVMLASCGGGGGGGGSTTTDGANPSIAFASSASGEVTRSVDIGVTIRIAVTASDDIGVTSVNLTLTEPGGATTSSVMDYDSVSDTWRVSAIKIPPIAGFDQYLWTATAADASGKTASVNGSFTINGPTPPSTGGAF